MKFFTPATFEFLDDLHRHNDRDWFALNKSRYLQDVQEPGLKFIGAMKKPLEKVAPYLVANASKSGGSMTRIYRDTRFSKDKTPYKTNVGIQFRHDAGEDIHAPGFYFHIAHDECFCGAGCYRPEASALAKIRAAVDADPKGWMKARDEKKFQATYSLWGESLKTSPRDYPRDHPMIADLKRKDFIGIAPLTRDQVISDSLIATVTGQLKASNSLMVFLCHALGVPY